MSIQGAINKGLSVTAGLAVGAQALHHRNVEAMKKAQAEAIKTAEAKKKQRRNFMDYLRKMPTSLGGNVGDLSYDLQKKIDAGIPSKQRQKIMNQADLEAKR